MSCCETDVKTLSEIIQYTCKTCSTNATTSLSITTHNPANMIPVYMPIVEEHHGVMLANSSKSLNKECFRYVLIDMEKQEEEIMTHDGNDTEIFVYRDKMAGSNAPMIEAVYFDAQKAKKVLFDGEMYVQFEYYEGGNLTAMYKNESEIPAFIDNGTSINVLPKAFYDE